jgi:hypothetical protein
MRKPLVIALTAGLVATSLAGPALAGKKKKPKPQAPVATTLYLHGNEVVGEVENYGLIASGTYMSMDATEPSGSEPKSKFFTNYVAGPNSQCAGNDFYPVWVGDLTGKVTGDVKVTFHSIASPGGIVDVRVWPDVASQLCTNETLGAFDYPEPAGEVRVSLPAGPGTVEAVIEGVDFQAGSKLMLQLTPDPASPFVGRALYDATSYVSKIEFSCIPAAGASACTP